MNFTLVMKAIQHYFVVVLFGKIGKFRKCIKWAPIVERADNFVQWVSRYPAIIAYFFLDSDFSAL